MRIGFIGFVPSHYASDFSLFESRVQARGHKLELLSFGDLALEPAGIEAVVDQCAGYDIVHYFAGFGDVLGRLIGEALKRRGVQVVNNGADLPPYVENKLYQAAAAAAAGIPVPKSRRAFRPVFERLAAELDLPFLAKKPRGTQGKGVYLIKTPADLAELDLPREYLYQEFVPHRNDFRVHILGGERAFCIYKRVPPAGSFKANVSQGASMEAVTDQAEREAVTELALRAARAMHYDLCGVDIFRSEADGQYRVIEINRNPGWKHVSVVTGESFEDALIDYYESRYAL